MRRTPSTESVHGARIKRILIYGALSLLLATAQCSFFAELHICPATPDLLLGLVLAVLLLDSTYAAAAVALGGGFLVDALGATGVFLTPLFYFAVVLVLLLPASKMMAALPSFALLALPALAMRALYTLLCFRIVSPTLPALSYLGGILWREALVTAILILPIFPLVHLCMRPLRTRGRFHF